ncbi:hypothetical protein E2C01_101221 [Portunus trituberculatus]|uniref:Uncharacterized protein n=1 Tax=Portunus trituberculatus TaxID=210409 RepID=A0A5B7KLE5_PORTR|nr:hypothetical protein [Portunus trituberculatus]
MTGRSFGPHPPCWCMGATGVPSSPRGGRLFTAPATRGGIVKGSVQECKDARLARTIRAGAWERRASLHHYVRERYARCLSCAEALIRRERERGQHIEDSFTSRHTVIVNSFFNPLMAHGAVLAVCFVARGLPVQCSLSPT